MSNRKKCEEAFNQRNIGDNHKFYRFWLSVKWESRMSKAINRIHSKLVETIQEKYLNSIEIIDEPVAFLSIA